MTENRKRELLLALVPALCDERGMEAGLGEDATTDELFSAFRALVCQGDGSLDTGRHSFEIAHTGG